MIEILYYKQVPRCGLCPAKNFDDQDDPERWGKYWCEYLDHEVDPEEIHKDCPFQQADLIPTTAIKDLPEDKLAELGVMRIPEKKRDKTIRYRRSLL